jgi:nitrogen-specific signal transduction histidine kinase
MNWPIELLVATALVAGGGCCWLGALSYRRWTEPGSTAFGAFLVVWGVVPTVAVLTDPVSETASSVIQVLLWCLATLWWFLFALQYSGAVTRIRPRTVSLLGIPSLVVVPWLWGPFSEGQSLLLETVATLTLTFYSGLVLIGAVLLVRVMRSYGHLSARHGLLLVATGVVPSITNIAFGILVDATGLTLLSSGIYAAGFVGVFLPAAGLLLRYDMFDTTLAAGTIGEQAIARTSEDSIFIVDDDQRILKLNDAAARTLDVQRSSALGSPLPAVTNLDIEALTERDSVDLRTTQGARTFDAQVTELTDQHGNRLGSMVTLRDVTDREIRRQRLEVLNRIMRHNLRNRVSVIEAHSEVVADAVGDDDLQQHLDTVSDSADSLATLGRKVKTIQELLDTDRSATPVQLDEFAEGVVADCKDRWPKATITLTRVDDVTVRGDREAMAFILETLVENTDQERPSAEITVEFDGSEQRYPLTLGVTDEGNAISSREIEVVQEGTETPLKHGTGVGLWVTNWTVTDLGGELSFEQRESGTVVRARLPFRRADSSEGSEDTADNSVADSRS